MDEMQLGESIHQPLTDLEVKLEANRCLYCYDAPCMNACPTHIEVASFIAKIASGNLIGSARVIMDANAMGASCARVCPTDELCEGACVYAKDDSPIRIGDLQRYAVDSAMQAGTRLFEAGASSGRSVAIIGGGPAGLATARDLRRMGHAVTIFDAHEQLGGLNTYGIVPFRLSVETALWEAQQVLSLGVEVRTGVRVGDDIAMERLLADFDAAVLACGMGGVPRLGIPGEDLLGVWDALDFIERVKCGAGVAPLGSRVIVIGAGNTAIDALICSRRLGRLRDGNADIRVTMYYRRGEEQMSAYGFEYEFAQREGVEFRFFRAPLRIVGQDGRVRGVEFAHTALKMQDGREVAVVLDETEFVPSDTVIRAIGQSRLSQTFEQLGIIHDAGVVRVDDALQSSRPGVFAAGDCIFAKGTREAMVVEAAQQGKIAARSVDAYLRANPGANHG